MKTVTQGFKNQIPLIGKRNDIEASYNGLTKKPERIKYMFKGDIFKTAMTEVEVDIKEVGNLVDQVMNVKFGLYVDDAFEYIEWNELYVYQCEVDEDKRLSKCKTYDKMINFMVLYDITSSATTLLNYLKDICSRIGIELYSESFFNADLPITEDYFVTQKVTFRDVLDQIAETTFTNISIKNGKLLLRDVKDGYATPEVLANNVIKKGTTTSYWGDVNTFNIGREPQSGDDAYVDDETMVEEDGVQELRFVNNQFLDKNRVVLAPVMFDHIKGLGFYPTKTETLGLGYVEFGDWFEIPDPDTGNIYKTIATTYEFTVTSGTKDIITSVVPSSAKGKYQYASAVEKRLTNTEIVVDKQANTITSITEEQSSMGTQLAKLQQDLNGFVFQIQESGNLNLVLNSVGWKGTDFWDISAGGSVTIINDTDVVNNTTSKSSFLVNGTSMTQTIQVKENNQYSATIRVKNSVLNTGHVRITNGIDNIDLCSFDEPQQATNWTKYDVTFTARSNFIYIIIYSEGNGIQTSDLVIAEGEIIQSWFPSADEIYTGNTKIDRNGVKVYNTASDKASGMENGEIYIDDANGRQVSLNPDLSYMNKLRLDETLFIGRLRYDVKDAGVDMTLIDEE
jgi:hypothetical protein